MDGREVLGGGYLFVGFREEVFRQETMIVLEGPLKKDTVERDFTPDKPWRDCDPVIPTLLWVARQNSKLVNIQSWRPQDRPHGVTRVLGLRLITPHWKLHYDH